jgi:hypothetical protein
MDRVIVSHIQSIDSAKKLFGALGTSQELSLQQNNPTIHILSR